jgi:hypothetical protein
MGFNPYPKALPHFPTVYFWCRTFGNLLQIPPHAFLGDVVGQRSNPKRWPRRPSFIPCTVGRRHCARRRASLSRDPQAKFLPFTFRPETGPTIRTLAPCRLPQIAPYGPPPAQTLRRLNSHTALRQPSAVSAVVSSCESVSRIEPGGRVMRSAERTDARPWLASCCWSDS